MKPNLLLITTDQQRWDTIHAAGNRHIFTPHLNWLKDTGIEFSRAYSDCPVCMPARATIMTGLPGYAHGAVSNAPVEPIRNRPTLPGLLTGAGYQTHAQGKMHFHPMRCRFGFESMELSYDYYRLRRQYDPDRVGSQHGMGQNEMEPVIGSTDASHTLTRWMVDRSIDFLETRDPEHPFFLWTSFSKPHPPFDPSAEFWSMYQDQPVPDPVYGDWSASFEDIPAGFLQTTAVLNNVDRFSPAQLAQIHRAYYACITEVDAALGRLFARLREKGLLENTLILFTSDHGEMLGDHWMGAKSTFFEGSAHVPLLIRPPGQRDQHSLRGTRCEAVVSLQDLLPTFLAAAGVQDRRPDDCPGQDLLALASGTAPGRRELAGQCSHLFMLLDGPWKYLLSQAGGDELLFNLEEDPGETRNRAGEQAKRCADMRTRLEARLSEGGADCLNVEGKMQATEPLNVDDDRRWRSWPGFHSLDEESDLLH